jgi:hypothetical protein
MADPYVHEVCMVAPDIMRVHVNDPPLRRGAVVDTGSAQSGNFGTWYDFPDPTRGNVTDKAWILGRGKRWIKFQDAFTGPYFAREPARVAGDYSITGGLAVDEVFYANDILDRGFWLESGSTVRPPIIFKHFLFLKLDAPVVSGTTYTIGFPAGTGLADYDFDFNDRTSRTPAIKVPFCGHRPNDDLKLSYLSEKVLGYDSPTGEGVIDYINDYSITTFDIVNRHGATVETYNIEVRRDWDESELGATGLPTGDPESVNGFQTYASSVQAPILVTAITGTTPPRMTVASGHGLAENDTIVLGYLQGLTNVVGATPNAICRVTNLSGDEFDLYRWNGSSWVAIAAAGTTYANGARLGGPADKVYKTYLSNTTATKLFGLDYSAFAPTTLPGFYAIRIPGVGISDYFEIDEHVYYKAAKIFAKYEYNQRVGCALDGRHGYTRAINMRHGVNGFSWTKNRLPWSWSNQGNVISGVVDVGNAADTSWNTGVAIDAGGGHMDAGDWDTFPALHLPQPIRFLMIKDLVPDMFEVADFNVPTTSSLEGPDYAGFDDAPSLVHMAWWSFGWMYRCQDIDGAVPSGTCGRREASSGPSGGFAEPSTLNHQTWYTFLPEPIVNFMYAGTVAMFARVLDELGYTDDAADYLASAELAYQWAEDIHRKLVIGQSTTSRTIGAGSVSFTVTVGTPAEIGDTVRIESAANTANYMEGTITARSQGSMTVNVTATGGSGTLSDWRIKLAEYDKNYYFASATGVKDTVTFTGDTTLNQHYLTNLSSTAGLSVGMQVTGTNLPGSGSTPLIIKSIDSSTQITLQPIGYQYDYAGTLISTAGVSANLATASGSGITFTACHPQGGWSQATFDAAITAITTRARPARTFALGALARAKGAAGGTYRTRFEFCRNDDNFISPDAFGRAEYVRDPLADTTIANSIKSNLATSAGLLNTTAGSASRTYRHIGTGLYAMNHHGEVNGHSLPLVQEFSSDDTLKTNARKAMQGAIGVTMGANPKGESYVKDSSLPRHINGMLHVDPFVLGYPIGGPDGITVYGPAWAHAGSGLSAFNAFANSSLSDVNHVYLSGNTTDDEDRVMEPFTAMHPLWRDIDLRFNVNEREFGLVGSLMNFLFAMSLHGHDGNTQAEPSPRRVSMTLQAG